MIPPSVIPQVIDYVLNNSNNDNNKNNNNNNIAMKRSWIIVVLISAKTPNMSRK